jgi:hypothetical protein
VGFFVWVKVTDDANETLEEIVERKERERAENGLFWWGLGSSLGKAVIEAAQSSGGTLPVLFSRSLGRRSAGQRASSPVSVYTWSRWKDASGAARTLPAYATVRSAASFRDRGYYALVCSSTHPLVLKEDGPLFDPSDYQTTGAKAPGASQTVALLRGQPLEANPLGKYRIILQATLVAPWFIKLTS